MLKPDKYINTKAPLWVPQAHLTVVDLSILNPQYPQDLQDRMEFLAASSKELKEAGWSLESLPYAQIEAEIFEIISFCSTAEEFVKSRKEVENKQILEARELAAQAQAELQEKYKDVFQLSSTGMQPDTDSNSDASSTTSYFPRLDSDTEDFSQKLRNLNPRRRNNPPPELEL